MSDSDQNALQESHLMLKVFPKPKLSLFPDNNEYFDCHDYNS